VARDAPTALTVGWPVYVGIDQLLKRRSWPVYIGAAWLLKGGSCPIYIGIYWPLKRR
jgi:hypothetical protein